LPEPFVAPRMEPGLRGTAARAVHAPTKPSRPRCSPRFRLENEEAAVHPCSVAFSACSWNAVISVESLS
jgi:hypothetical protein